VINRKGFLRTSVKRMEMMKETAY